MMTLRTIRGVTISLSCLGLLVSCKPAQTPAPDTTDAISDSPSTKVAGGIPYIRKDKGGGLIIVEAGPGKDAYTVNMKKTPPFEKFVGLFRNLGNGGIKGGVEATYDFDNEDVAEYDLVILPKSDAMGRTLWEIRERRKDGTAAKPPRSGYLDICHTHAAKPPKVGFKDCNAPDDEQVDPHRPVGDTDPAWVSCTDGCCTLKETKKGGDSTHKG